MFYAISFDLKHREDNSSEVQVRAQVKKLVRQSWMEM